MTGSSVTISSTGNISYSSFTIGIHVGSWNFKEYDANTIASTFDTSQSWWVYDPVNDPAGSWDYSAKIDAVHSINPDYKALVYRNCMSIHDYWSDEFNLADRNGWLLKDATGNYVRESLYSTNYMVDITNKSYQQWLGVKVKSWLVQCIFFDGVFADNSLKYTAKEWSDLGTSRPINPSTGTYFTDQEIRDGCVGVLNAIIDGIGPSKLVVANGVWSGFVWDRPEGEGYRYILSRVPRLSGINSEGCFYIFNNQWLNEVDWLSSVNFVSWMQDNFLVEPGKTLVVGSSANSPPSGATRDQMILYGFCSLLLSVKHSSPQNAIYFNIDYWNSPETSLVQRLGRLNVDSPLGAYYKISSTSVYVRDFMKCKVLVNPSNMAFAIPLDRAYTTLNGEVVSGSLTVNAHTGLLLLR